MRLLRVQVINYPLLHDLDVDLDPVREDRCRAILLPHLDRPNLYLALQWALFGEVDLPWAGARNPSRTSFGDASDITPTVRIDYSGGELARDQREYRLIRSARPELAGSKWKMPDGDVKLFEVTAAGMKQVKDGAALLATHIPTKLRPSLFCSWEDYPFEWHGTGQPALSIRINGGPMAALRTVDSLGREDIGHDFNAIVSSATFCSGFPGKPPISKAMIDADGLLWMFDDHGELLDPYFAQPAGVQCALNQALVLALARFWRTPTVFESPFAVYDLCTRQAMVRLISRFSLQAVLLLSEVDGREGASRSPS